MTEEYENQLKILLEASPYVKDYTYTECKHEFFNSCCITCGLIIDEVSEKTNIYEENITTSFTDKKSIIDTIEGIPEEVKIKARGNMLKYLNENGKNIRNDNKNTFNQLYKAYFDAGIYNFDPIQLGRKLKLKRKDINFCMNEMSGFTLVNKITSGTGGIRIVHPIVFIEQICKLNEMDNYIPEIKKLTNYIIKEKDILLSTKPKNVACAIVKCFMEKCGIPTRGFKVPNKISDTTLKNVINDIKIFF